MKAMGWIRWRIGDGFSVWHWLDVSPSPADRLAPLDDAVLVAFPARRAGALRVASRAGVAQELRARCGTPVPGTGGLELGGEALEAMLRCVMCLRSLTASSARGPRRS